MKLVRHGAPGKERPAAIDANGRLRDLGGLIGDIDNEALGSEAWKRVCQLPVNELNSLPDLGAASEARLGPCVGGVGKVVCMGLNERNHALEIKAEEGRKPNVFLKPTSAINGPGDPVMYPKVAQKVDWENELAIVIGERCKHVQADAALDGIAGFCIMNDMSDRHWQTEPATGKMSRLVLGKAFDTFAPLGPWLVTPDEIPDPDALSIKLWVNDKLRQDFSSADYIYNVRETVAFCSQFFTLYPGDVIAMGSGPGNAFTWNEYLKVGDVVRGTIEGLGTQEFRIVEEH